MQAIDFESENAVEKAVDEFAQLQAAEGFTPDVHMHALALAQEFRLHPSHFKAELQFANFMDQVRVEPWGCWQWLGQMHQWSPTYGRGAFRCHAVHQALEHAARPRPDGRVVKNTCGNRGCVNPAHYRWVTRTAIQKNG